MAVPYQPHIARVMSYHPYTDLIPGGGGGWGGLGEGGGWDDGWEIDTNTNTNNSLGIRIIVTTARPRELLGHLDLDADVASVCL